MTSPFHRQILFLFKGIHVIDQIFTFSIFMSSSSLSQTLSVWRPLLYWSRLLDSLYHSACYNLASTLTILLKLLSLKSSKYRLVSKSNGWFAGFVFLKVLEVFALFTYALNLYLHLGCLWHLLLAHWSQSTWY